MNPLTQFKKILILPLLITLALVVVAAAPAIATASGEFGAWSAPINVGPPLNTQYNDTYPILTADGLTVYFTSDRPGGLGGDDLWVSRRESTDSAWEEPENLAVLNSPTTRYRFLVLLETSCTSTVTVREAVAQEICGHLERNPAAMSGPLR